MTRTILVSGADRGYYELLSDLLQSVRSHKPAKDLSIGVLDLGLDTPQREQLDADDIKVIEPGWDYRFSKCPPRYLQAMTARPHLQKYFPGYDLYMWMDADTWVQDWKAVKLYLESAKKIGFAITPQVHRCYSPMMDNISAVNWWYKRYAACFDERIAKTLSLYPIINSGVFAARADVPHWKLWARILGNALGRSVNFFSEQASLNFMVYSHELDVAYLPAQCNWMCSRAIPLCSDDGRIFHEPAPPYEKIGVVHMTGKTKDKEYECATRSGGTVVRSLRYSASICTSIKS